MSDDAPQPDRIDGARHPRDTPQLGDFTGIGLANDIAGQALLAGLHELLGPFIIQALGNAFAAAQLGNTVFTA